MDDKIHMWKSGADVMARWRKLPYPTRLNRWDVYGKQDIIDEPLEKHRNQTPTQWIPPSEDPYYQEKWAFWRKLFAESGKSA